MPKYVTLSLSILVLWVLSGGCEHWTYYTPGDTGRHYTPRQIPIKPGMVHRPDFTISKEVILVNAQTSTHWTLLGAYTHQWYGNLRLWTDTALSVARDEFKKRGVRIKSDLPLFLKLYIAPDEKTSMLVGVVSRECPLDPDTNKEHPLDTDKDGVPDYLDKCPDTPQGVQVNGRGCPLDTDHDSLPDYRDHCPRIPQGFKIDNMPFGKNGVGLPENPAKYSPWLSEIYLVSSLPADRVMRLLRHILQTEGISVDEDTPGMLRFNATVPVWTDRFSTIRAALQEGGVQLTKRMPRILQLAVTDVSLIWETREIGCRLNLRVVTGEGDILDFQGTNFAIDLHDSCDGAVTKEVVAMFNDERIRTYLAAPPEPKDTDCDGIPDGNDPCPGTPLGVKVDDSGCPLDTDGDGVPDYLDECPDTLKGVKVDKRGCPLDSDGDGVPDYQDKCHGTPKGVSVDGSGCPIDRDLDGVPDYLDQCPDTPKGMKVDKRGCPLDSDGDGVADPQDTCPGTPKGARVDAEGCWVIHEAFFDFDKYQIKPRFYPIFDEVVTVLNNNPSVKIMIEGYTDNIGTEAYNQKLSEARAVAVKNYLIKKGIQSDRLSTVGYGSAKPRATNNTNAGRALNRRVKLEPLPEKTK